MTITEVSKKYNLSADTLRYYERIGLIPRVNRTSGGIRNYSEADCGWVKFIKCMRGAGLPVETLIEYVSLFQQGDTTIPARKEILMEERNRLEKRIKEMQETLEHLTLKIDKYEKILVPKERELKNSL